MRVSARGFTTYELSEDGERILVTLSGKLYVVERATGKVTELKTGPGVIDPRFSPDGKQIAYVREQRRVPRSTSPPTRSSPSPRAAPRRRPTAWPSSSPRRR